jgi:hypothetical protein
MGNVLVVNDGLSTVSFRKKRLVYFVKETAKETVLVVFHCPLRHFTKIQQFTLTTKVLVVESALHFLRKQYAILTEND